MKLESWDIVPDLCVEVISPSNTAYEVENKIIEYFEAGVPQVWIVYPDQRTLKVYESRYRAKILGLEDTLKGSEVLAGFELPLKQLFRAKVSQESK